jgi:CheY-like chemotaxis protein
MALGSLFAATLKRERMVTVGSELLHTRVLALDDDHDTLEIMGVLLDAHGAQTALAGSATEALAMLKTHRPEVILSDIAMPGDNGYDFVRWVRALPRDEGGETPAVAVSAHVYAADRERAFDAGFQAFLAKPISPRALIECVTRLVKRARAHQERRHTARRAGHTGSGTTFERRNLERRQPAY